MTTLAEQALVIALGLSAGSFANVAIHRWPADRSVLSPPSQCPTCAQPVRGLDRLPILSWVILRGRCRSCHAPLSASYPVGEALLGVLAWLLWRRLVPFGDLAEWLNFGSALFFTTLLVIATYSDVRQRIIPDQTSLWMIPTGVLLAAALEALGVNEHPTVGWRRAVSGALVGGGTFWCLATTSRWVSGQEALGQGDVKLMGAIGAFLGPVGALCVMLWASFLGSVVGIAATIALRRRLYPPFAPPLALAALTWVLFGDSLGPRFFPGLMR
jgi:leader peptidase (prepilin peptidase)/N-methyltransferase